MKTITLLCCLCLVSICTISSAQDQIDINELLSRFNESHMGAITDVFTSDELVVLEAHYAALRGDDTNFDNRGPKIRLYGPENVGGNFGFIDTTAPNTFNTIGPSGTADFDGAGAIFPGSTTGHVIDNAGNFYEVDILTGQYIPMGTIAPPAGENFTGLEFNPNNGMLFGISTDGTTNQSTLSTINPVNMTASPIGNTGLRLPIALSISGNGSIFSYDIDDDILYRLNPNTGAPTAVGPIGFNADFGGGMCFDPNTNKTFITSYNPAIGDSQLREINTDTGLTIVVGTINPGPTSQMAWGGIVNSLDLGISDTTLSGFRFYPNPATDVINLSAVVEIESVVIHNMLDQKLLDVQIQNVDGVLDVSNIAVGSYILTAQVDGRKGSYHFIKR